MVQRSAERRVLVVDADEAGRAFAAGALGFAGFEVIEAPDAPEALELLGDRDGFAAVVASVDLPSMSGVALTRRIREASDVAIVVLSTSPDSMLAVVALEAGVDDHCVVPMAGRELVLRVERSIDRHGARYTEETPVVVAEDGLVIDPVARIAAVDGAEVELTAKEFDLLVVLASSPGTVFTRGELLQSVWDAKPDWQSVDTVTEHVYRLRQKLAGASPEPREWIHTVRGAGYRFAAPASARPHLIRPVAV